MSIQGIAGNGNLEIARPVVCKEAKTGGKWQQIQALKNTILMQDKQVQFLQLAACITILALGIIGILGALLAKAYLGVVGGAVVFAVAVLIGAAAVNAFANMVYDASVPKMNAEKSLARLENRKTSAEKPKAKEELKKARALYLKGKGKA